MPFRFHFRLTQTTASAALAFGWAACLFVEQCATQMGDALLDEFAQMDVAGYLTHVGADGHTHVGADCDHSASYNNIRPLASRHLDVCLATKFQT